MSGTLDAPISFAKSVVADVRVESASPMRTAMTSGSAHSRPVPDTSPLRKKDIG